MSKGGTKTSTSTTEIPEPYRRFAENQLAAAGTMQNRPYVRYESPMVAGFNSIQRDGMTAMQNLKKRGYGGGIAREGMAATQDLKQRGYGGGIAREVAGYTPGSIASSDLSAYQNPYEDQVVARSLADIDRSRQMAMQGVNDQAVSAGAFGGSRAGVQAGLTNEAYGKQAADTAAQLRQAGYQNAQTMAGADIATGLSGAQLRNQAASQLQQSSTAANAAEHARIKAQMQAADQLRQSSVAADAAEQSRINAQMQAGGAYQQMDQSGLDLAHRAFLEEMNYPISALSIGQSILGQTPMGSTTRQAVPRQSMLPGLLGGAGKLAMGLGKGGLGWAPFCWVAREVYGIDNPKWLIFKRWMLDEAPQWFRSLYLAHGERFALWIANKPLLKRVIRAGMDLVVDRKIREARHTETAFIGHVRLIVNGAD
jgi:hypothetical protein